MATKTRTSKRSRWQRRVERRIQDNQARIAAAETPLERVSAAFGFLRSAAKITGDSGVAAVERCSKLLEDEAIELLQHTEPEGEHHERSHGAGG